MAELNMKYYTNTDQYSDGDIENDIFDIVKGEKNIDDFLGEYPVIYHLSPVRENIVNWYPFEKKGNCLEIGAGCGAITGALCKKLKNVVSVDISERRSAINYERHKDCDNLEIIVGNIHEIEFENKFDYIVLNGVFEYAMSFTHTEGNPYTEFLSYVKTLLNENGHILIAIENRLGLKYFLGAPEDHTNEYFLGINSYANNETVRTFSKAELSDIVYASGFKNIKFYYPYPDYKFPSEIFTDSTIIDFNYGRPYFNMNSKAMEIVNESKVFESLVNEGVVDKFANSFFVDITNNKKVSNVVYAKLNAERNEKFRIATIISEEKNRRIVEKKPLTEVAKEHINNIYKNAQNTVSKTVKNGKANLSEDGVFYEYYDLKNMDSIAAEYIEEENIEKVADMLNDFYRPFIENAKACKYHNEKFAEIFGDAVYRGELKCIKPANIDMICDNIMVKGGKYTLIDTEWIFDINIPIQFIIWRTIRELFAKHQKLIEISDFESFISRFGINSSMSEVFYKWTIHFINDYVGNGYSEKFAVNKKNVDLNTVYYSMANVGESSLYINKGQGFNELDKIVCDITPDNEGNFYVKYNIPKDTVELRWDPVELKYCKCRIDYINGEIIRTNGCKEDGFDVFDNGDPQYNIKTNDKELVIKGKIFIKNINESALLMANNLNNCINQINEKDYIIKEKNNGIQQLSNENAELNTKNAELNRQNAELNNTKDSLLTTVNILESKSNINSRNQEFMIQQITLLKSQIVYEQSRYNEIISSKGWKFLDALRKFIVMFRR